MLKNSQTTYQHLESDPISVADNHEVNAIWAFIDCHISGFIQYYCSDENPKKENKISELLIYYFFCCMSEQMEGFPPYCFARNPTQYQSERETDIGVFAIIPNEKPITLIEFEAKRLSEKSNNKEYVCGERGGIERFKRGVHASHLPKCGMFAYIQNNNTNYWINKINGWICELSDVNTDSTIHWSNEEVLHKVSSNSQVEKYASSHQRLLSNDTIALWHYFIEL